MLQRKQPAECRMTAVQFISVLSLAVPATAQELAQQADSLKLVPASAPNCTVLLRNREQWQACVNSKAWAKLKALPFMKQGWQKLEREWTKEENPLKGLGTWFKQA